GRCSAGDKPGGSGHAESRRGWCGWRSRRGSDAMKIRLCPHCETPTPVMAGQSYCYEHKKEVKRRSVAKNQHRPCSKCGEKPRQSGSVWCTPCLSLCIERNQHRPCSKCGVGGRREGYSRCDGCLGCEPKTC